MQWTMKTDPSGFKTRWCQELADRYLAEGHWTRPTLRDVARSRALLHAHKGPDLGMGRAETVDALLLTTTRIGTFAEEVVVPEEMVIPIRKDMPWPQAALVGCCVATGVGAVTRHAKVEAGSTVLVIGCGGVGLNAVQGAMLSGASKIIAADILDNKLDMARTFGATHTVNTATDNDPVKKVKEITGGLGVDYSFDAVSIDRTQALAFDALAPGGHAVAVGISAATVKAQYSPMMMVFAEKTMSGTFYGSVRPDLDFPVLVDHYMNKRLNIDGLISRTYRLEEINEGFKRMMAGEVARGVVVFD